MEEATIIATIADGKLRGKISKDIRGEKFYSFQGIPYATPPLGNLRFKAPQPAQKWEGIRDATIEGNECLSKHIITKEIVGSENCLNLNVYSPNLENRDIPSRPVMFWIHGGSFLSGSNKREFYGPEFLLPENVVVVTINYRLGILGFLSLDDATLGVPGNAGFKDMILALKWVQRNIHVFGGNRNNVTVFGNSAGAAAAHLLMLSPMSKNLFHKVIAQSSCALNNWVKGNRTAGVIAKNLGFYSSDDNKLLKFLQNTPAEDILQAQMKIHGDYYTEHGTNHFGLVIERLSESEEPFMIEEPLDVLLSGKYNQVPLLMGYNNKDGMAFEMVFSRHKQALFLSDIELSVPNFLKLQRKGKLSKEIAAKLKQFYFSDGKIIKQKHLKQVYEFFSDTLFFRGIYSSVKNHANISNQPVFLYRMSLETELNYYKKLLGLQEPGVCHCDELGYLFKSILTPEIQKNSVEDIGQRRITKMWTNFAKFANPTPNRNDPLLSVEWKPVDKKCTFFLDIGEELSLQIDPEPERMRLWDEIFRTNPAASKL